METQHAVAPLPAALEARLGVIIGSIRQAKRHLWRLDAVLYRDHQQFDAALRAAESDMDRKMAVEAFERATACTIAAISRPVASAAASAPMVAA